MATINPNMANREVCNLTFVDYKTKLVRHVLDYAITTTSEITGESNPAYGGQGYTQRMVFHGKRGGTLKIETQITPFELFSMISGATIENTAEFIAKETATTTTEKPTITLTGTPATGYPVTVFHAGTTNTAVPATVTGTTVTLTTPTPGTYDIWYLKTITENVKSMTIKSNTFASNFTVYGETVDMTESGEILPHKVIWYKACPQPNFTITNSSNGEPTKLDITLDLLSDSDNRLYNMILIEEDQGA